MLNNISLSSLRVFEVAARLGAFKAAAKELALSPTAVSHQIRNLEAQLGLALFIRKTREVALTEAGTLLAAATSDAFENLSSVLEELQVLKRRLTVSTTPAFASLWLVPRMISFEEKHPDIELHLDTSTTMVDLRRDRQIDLAIRYGKGNYQGLFSMPVAGESFAAYGTEEVLRKYPILSSAPLIETRWKAENLPAVTWQSFLNSTGSPAEQSLELRTFAEEQQAIQAALAGQGILLASSLLVSDLVARGWLRSPQPEKTLKGFSYTAVALPEHAKQPKVRLFLDWLEKQR